MINIIACHTNAIKFRMEISPRKLEGSSSKRRAKKKPMSVNESRDVSQTATFQELVTVRQAFDRTGVIFVNCRYYFSNCMCSVPGDVSRSNFSNGRGRIPLLFFVI